MLFNATHLNMKLFSFARTTLSLHSLFHACTYMDIQMMWLQITKYQYSNVKRPSPYLFHLAYNGMWMSYANWSLLYTDVIYACEKLEECFTRNLDGHYSRPHIVCEYPSVFSTIGFCSAVIRKLVSVMWKPKVWWTVDQWWSYGSELFLMIFFFN